ncbi:hypothetical protein XANCAGTX0491_001256 [Xanthoria calcicola]
MTASKQEVLTGTLNPESQLQTQNEVNLVRSNRDYANSFNDGNLSHVPARKYVMARRRHVIRNAGGSDREALRSLVFSNQLLGTTEIFVIKHTHCGLSVNTNDSINQTIAKNLGEDALAEFNGLDWFPFAEPEQGVKDDIAFLKASKAIPESIDISGWVYDVETGKVGPVRN